MEWDKTWKKEDPGLDPLDGNSSKFTREAETYAERTRAVSQSASGGPGERTIPLCARMITFVKCCSCEISPSLSNAPVYTTLLCTWEVCR